MPASHFYMERLREDLHREIAWAIANRVRDPRVPEVVSVLEVRLAPDTRNATILVSIMGEKQARKEAIAGLNAAAPFIQKVVGERIKIKHFPRLYFKIDNSLDFSQHLNELLDEIKDDLA